MPERARGSAPLIGYEPIMVDLKSQPAAGTSGSIAGPLRRARFPLFDSLRAIAALCVVLYHVGAIDGGYRNSGLGIYGSGLAIGVPIFFLISGFLLYRPFAAARAEGARRPRTGSYLRRRALRILPAYWVALTFLGITAGLTGVFTADWWRYYGLVQIYDARTFGHGLGVAWTLCIEVSFYLFLPLYALAWDRAAVGWQRVTAVRSEALLLVVLAFASLAFRHWADLHSGRSYLASTLPGTFYLFALGMGLAVWSVQGRKDSSSLIRIVDRFPDICWALAIALFVLTANVRSTIGAVASFAAQGVIAFLLLLPAVFGSSESGLSRRILRNRALLWIGLISYSVYLYHATLIPALRDHGVATAIPGSAWVNVAAATLALVLILAGVSYYVVERPAQRLHLGKRRLPRYSHNPTAGWWIRAERARDP
jgi:peptidoglycan/LPS O-acetylase OafA/YrhL